MFLPRGINKRINKINKYIRDTYIIDDVKKKAYITNVSDFNKLTHSFKDYTIISNFERNTRENNSLYKIIGLVNLTYEEDTWNYWMRGEEYNIVKTLISFDPSPFRSEKLLGVSDYYRLI
jgi:hypothetical protein